MGYDIDAIIEDTETYLVIITTVIKTIKAIIAAYGDKPINNPNKVAIPFPPLNPVYIGNKCPITAEIPNAS